MTEAQAQGGIVVRLRGLPTKASKEDVAEFLREWRPKAVYLSFTARRSTGEAYVVFDTLDQAEGACSKDKDIFGPKFGERYVRVCIQEDTCPADLQSLDGAPKASKPRRPSQKMDTVVKVGGLPRGITPPEVLQLFWGWQIRVARTFVRDTPHTAAAAAAAAVVGTAAATSSGGGGSSCGGTAERAEAFIDFEHAEHAAAAISTRHGTTITTAAGMFQLSVQKAGKAEWEVLLAAAAGHQQQQQHQGGGGANAAMRSEGVVRLRGLPARAASGDVLAFFQEYRVKLGGVHVQPFSEGGRHGSSGGKVALVEFESPQEAARAMERDRQRLGEAFGDCCPQLDLVPRCDFEAELRRFFHLHHLSPTANTSNGGQGNSSSSGGTLGTGLGAASLAALPAGNGSSMGGVVSSMDPLGMHHSLHSMGAMAAAGMAAGLGATLGGFGMLPQAAAAAAGFMTPGLPRLPAGVMLPQPHGFGLGGMPPMPGVPGGGCWPPAAPAASHMTQPFGAPAPSATAGTLPSAGVPGMPAVVPPGMFPAPVWPGIPPMAGPGLPPNPATARYMVQDLTTGQKVFLDPRFNLSGYGTLPPPNGQLASCSAVATAGTTYGGTANGPAASQQQVQSSQRRQAGGKSSQRQVQSSQRQVGQSGQHQEGQSGQRKVGQSEAGAELAAMGVAATQQQQQQQQAQGGEMSEDSNRIKSGSGQDNNNGGGEEDGATAHNNNNHNSNNDGGQSRDPADPAANCGGSGGGGNTAGGGSSGNGYSVAIAEARGGVSGGAATPGMSAGAAGAGAGSIQQHASPAAPADGSGGGTVRQGSNDQIDAVDAQGQPHHAPKHRHSHHHHHHSHHHHHHHYRMRSAANNANNGGSSGDEGRANGGGSSGDEGRTNGGSGGGSNDGGGSDGGAGSGADQRADGGATTGADGSSGEGSGAEDGRAAAARTAATTTTAQATAEDFGFSRQAGPDGSSAADMAADVAADMEEDAAAPAAPAVSAVPPRQLPAQAEELRDRQGCHARSPLDAAALRAEGVEVPPGKRAKPAAPSQ